MDRQTTRDVARLLVKAGMRAGQLTEKQEKEKERKANSPVTHLRKCLRDQLVIDKYQKIREALING